MAGRSTDRRAPARPRTRRSRSSTRSSRRAGCGSRGGPPTRPYRANALAGVAWADHTRDVTDARRFRKVEIVAQDPSVRRGLEGRHVRRHHPLRAARPGTDGLCPARRRLRRIDGDVLRAGRDARRRDRAGADQPQGAAGRPRVPRHQCLRPRDADAGPVRVRARATGRVGRPGTPAQGGPPRLRGGQRLLLPRSRGDHVRLHPHDAAHVPVPLPRHRRPRDRPRAARRPAGPVHGAVVGRSGRAARSLRRHRRPAVGLLARRRARPFPRHHQRSQDDRNADQEAAGPQGDGRSRRPHREGVATKRVARAWPRTCTTPTT